MSECEQHQKIKYGDIIYIEYTSKDHTRNILKANGFNMVGKNYIEVEQLNITEGEKQIIQKDINIKELIRGIDKYNSYSIVDSFSITIKNKKIYIGALINKDLDYKNLLIELDIPNNKILNYTEI